MATDAKGNKSDSTTHDPLRPALVGTAAWLVPGLGYWMIGQKSRAIAVGASVISLFILGLLIGGVRVIEVPTYDHNGQATLTKTGFVAEVRSKPWSIAQIMTGPLSILGGAASVLAARPNGLFSLGSDSHSRVNEIAVLYTAVAGMLNLLAIIDSAHRAEQMSEDK